MTTATNSLPPVGWYPDPAGEREWRAWNGRHWTTHTRPYGDPPVPLARELDAIHSLNHLIGFGSISYYAGLGLIIDALHHRGGAAGELSSAATNVLIIVGVTLFFIGHLAYARSAIELEAGGAWLAGLPLINTVVWFWRVGDRASYPLGVGVNPAATRRQVRDGAVVRQSVLLSALVLYGIFPLPHYLVLSVLVHLLPAVGFLVTMLTAQRLRDDLVG